LLEPGDEVLLPDPAWPNYRMIAHLLGTRVLPYPLVAGGGFLPRLEDPERLVSPRTRAVLVNSPSNPLGTVVPRGLMEGLLAFARERDLWFISDEVYDDVFVSAGSVADSKDRLVARGLPGCAPRPGQDPHGDAGADHLVRQHPGPDGRLNRPAGDRANDERLL
jgi:aspartate/methionine/tyrosine aminotransferase